MVKGLKEAYNIIVKQLQEHVATKLADYEGLTHRTFIRLVDDETMSKIAYLSLTIDLVCMRAIRLMACKLTTVTIYDCKEEYDAENKMQRAESEAKFGSEHFEVKSINGTRFEL